MVNNLVVKRRAAKDSKLFMIWVSGTCILVYTWKQRSEGSLARCWHCSIQWWVFGRRPFLASAEAVEIDRVLSGHIGALHRIKFSETLTVLYLQPQG